jgi:hypothetical protein
MWLLERVLKPSVQTGGFFPFIGEPDFDARGRLLWVKTGRKVVELMSVLPTKADIKKSTTKAARKTTSANTLTTNKLS